MRDVARFCPACPSTPGLELLPAYLSVLASTYRDPAFLEQDKYRPGQATAPVQFDERQRAAIMSRRYLRALYGVPAP